MNEQYRYSSGALRESVVSISAYDAAGACIAREQRPALEAYTTEIDLIDNPQCRQGFGIRRIIAEQQESASAAPTTRWEMEYDERGTLTEALEQRLGARQHEDTLYAAAFLKLAQRLRWIGVPGAGC